MGSKPSTLLVLADLASSYDGEADEPAPPPKEEPTPAEPEPATEQNTAPEDPWQPDTYTNEPDVKTENKQDEAADAQPKHDDDYDRPLQIKEDGYV